MKKLLALTALMITLTSFGKTIVETTNNSADSVSSAKITITGMEAKKLIAYLSEVSQYSGSYVAEDAGMGKFYISAPGISCRTLNMGHLEADQINADKMYRCEVSFGATGSIKL